MDEDVVRVLKDDGSADLSKLAGDKSDKSDDALVASLYERMVLVRQLDLRFVALQRDGKIAFHSGSQGEEAAILGAAAAVRANDWLFPSSRELGAALWRGMPLAAYAHHMFGNAKDSGKGRQMPDHYASRAAKCASISSPTGTQIIHATGFAWAAKLKKDDVAALAFFGDGATSSADFHNGLNFAGVFKVPVVFFCRNNGWALTLPASRQTASESLAIKGIGYGVPFVRVDGNDLLAVLHVTREAIARAAAGQGATLIEALTDAADARDPLVRTRRYLENLRLWSDAKQAELEARVADDIEAAVSAAVAEEAPARDTLFDDVYAELPAHLREQRETARSPSRDSQ